MKMSYADKLVPLARHNIVETFSVPPKAVSLLFHNRNSVVYASTVPPVGSASFGIEVDCGDCSQRMFATSSKTSSLVGDFSGL